MLTLRQFQKQANPVQQNPIYLTPQSRQQAQADVLNKLIGLGVAGVGLGAAARGVGGLAEIVEPDMPVQQQSQLPQSIPLFRTPPKVLRRRRPAVKAAEHTAAPAGPAAAPFVPAGGVLAKNVAPLMRVPETRNVLADQYVAPMAIGATMAGLYGGYRGLDWLLGKGRTMARKQELSDAKHEYETALMDQYRAAMEAKTAADNCGIDELFTQLTEACVENKPTATIQEKVAFLLNMLPSWLQESYKQSVGPELYNTMMGGVNAASGIAALGAGAVGYSYAKDRSRKKLLEKALRERAMQRQQISPAPIYADVPVDLIGSG